MKIDDVVDQEDAKLHSCPCGSNAAIELICRSRTTIDDINPEVHGTISHITSSTSLQVGTSNNISYQHTLCVFRGRVRYLSADLSKPAVEIPRSLITPSGLSSFPIPPVGDCVALTLEVIV